MHGTDERLHPRQAQGLGGAAGGEGRYSSTSDYIRDLVRRDQEQEEKLRWLQAAIDEGLAPGVSERDPFEYLAMRWKAHSGGWSPFLGWAL